jgi:hypothetical protein
VMFLLVRSGGWPALGAMKTTLCAVEAVRFGEGTKG